MGRSAMKFFTISMFFIAGAAAAATCPFSIPVVTLPPQQVAGFSWGSVIRPMGDACIQAIEVDPTNDKAWYAGSFTGLYLTKDGGATWTKPVNGNVSVILVVHGQPQLVYAAAGNQLYHSRDSGKTWTLIHTFPKPVRSLLVAAVTLTPASDGTTTSIRAASSSPTSAPASRPFTRSGRDRRASSSGRSRAIRSAA